MKFRCLAVFSAIAVLLGVIGCKKESVDIKELEKSLVGLWWDEYDYSGITEAGIPFSKVLLAIEANANHTGCIYLGVFDDKSDNPLAVYGGPDDAGFTWELLGSGQLRLSVPTSRESVATRADGGSYGNTMTDVSGTNVSYTNGSVTVNNSNYSGTLQKADAGKQTEIQKTLASEGGDKGNSSLEPMDDPQIL